MRVCENWDRSDTALTAQTLQTTDGESPRIRRRWTGCCSVIVPRLFIPLEAASQPQGHEHIITAAQGPKVCVAGSQKWAARKVWGVGVGASSRQSFSIAVARQTSTSVSTAVGITSVGSPHFLIS